MARRRTPLDAFIDAYLDLEPTDRPFALVAIKAADRVLRTREAITPIEKAIAEDLGAAAAGEE